ncbi:MAG: DUF6020 family protein [Peptococcaceae bacterium]|nr:DUF6020 family protein [Peptococcaceae bacterium]
MEQWFGDREIQIMGSSNTMIYFMLIVFLIYMARRAFAVRDSYVIKYSVIAAFLVSGIEIVGRSLDHNDGLNGLLRPKAAFIVNSVEFLGLLVVSYCAVALLFAYLLKEDFLEKVKSGFLGEEPRKAFFLFWGIILAAWVPFFIMYYPGILTFDSMSQIHQIMGHIPMNASHPILHTFIISIFVKIGDGLGNMNIAVALFSITQMLLMSCIFAFSVVYVMKKGMHRVFVIGLLAYFSLFPVHGMYSITMWKDVLFGGVMLLFTICCIEMLTNADGFLGNRWCLGLFALATLGIMLMRNNGFYVFLLCFPFLIIFLKGYRKRLGAIFVGCLLFYTMLMGPFSAAINIEKGMGREALSVPMQQIARVAKYRGDDLADADWESIRRFFPAGDTVKYYTESVDAVKDYLIYIYMTIPSDNIGEHYNPRQSNPVKDRFDEDYYQANKAEFFTEWFKVFLRFPKEYMESYLMGSYGYWYPDANYSIVPYGGYSDIPEIMQTNPFPGLRGFLERCLGNMQSLPVFSVLCSIGFVFMLLILSVFVACLKKQYQLTLAFLPVLCLLLTATASPVYAEFRYVYSLFTCFPILLALVLWCPSHASVTKFDKDDIILVHCKSPDQGQ